MKTKRASVLHETVRLRLTHLIRLTGPFGLYEHAIFDRPRVSHGYTTDDNARALIALERMGGDAFGFAEPYRRFVLAAATPNGFHNRLGPDGRWRDRLGSDDAQGRAFWGLAHLADRDPEAAKTLTVWKSFDSPHPRANAYAALAFCELARRDPGFTDLEAALRRFSQQLPRPILRTSWQWPAERLTYANARIPQALIEAGLVLEDSSMVDDGLDLLAWLISAERGETGFSFTPVGGRGPGDEKPGFDQQPIEAWAMADACLAASRIDPSFTAAFHDAVQWFLGWNDGNEIMYDSRSGAGFDGLCRNGINLNRGAESTLSALATLAAATGGEA